MPERALFTVLRGHPDDAELAALTAVLLALLGTPGQPAGVPPGHPGAARAAGAPHRASWGRAGSRRRSAVSWAAP
ncbi:acyl-CoA carboxylase epsilon subunit [Streptomyces sp. NPDC018045]|uniref:acyl-CoA carboxylase epsilon subunit n=1 Tax=Streptomyces sp. NPDC018045 TaxID=3365037 RepID=UPI0037994DDF